VVSRAKAGDRWGTLTAADGDPEGDTWLPNECDARIRSTWFWKTNHEHTLKSLDQLMEMYEKSVGRGGVLLLNQTPDRTGRIPEADAKRTAEFGAEIQRRYGTLIGKMSQEGDEAILTFSERIQGAMHHMVMMEDISQGQRVLEYIVEAEVDGAWQQVTKGTSVGYKKIDRVQLTRATRLRWKCTKALGQTPPRLKSFGVAPALMIRE